MLTLGDTETNLKFKWKLEEA